MRLGLMVVLNAVKPRCLSAPLTTYDRRVFVFLCLESESGYVQTHRITVELNYSVRAPVFRVLGKGTNDWVHFALCWLTLTEWFYFYTSV